MATKNASKTSTTAPAKTSTANDRRPDAIKLLTADHKEVHALFVAFKKLADNDEAGDERQAIADKVCTLLTVHATIEEEIFYPAARTAEVDADLLDEAEVEHASAKELISQIMGMDVSEPLFNAKVIVLGEYIDHHVKEEQDELFPQCKKSDMDLRAIGEALAERKEELMSELGQDAMAGV